LHPAITLNDSYKKEKFKCFLHGKYKKKEVYIIPSFVPLVFGYDFMDINKLEKGFSFIDNSDLKNFDVVIYNKRDNIEYNFGKLKRLIR